MCVGLRPRERIIFISGSFADHVRAGRELYEGWANHLPIEAVDVGLRGKRDRVGIFRDHHQLSPRHQAAFGGVPFALFG
jgi:hypothetical protein